MSGIIGVSQDMKSGVGGGYPTGNVVQIVTGRFNGGDGSYGVTGSNPGGEISTNFRFPIVPKMPRSKIIVSYQSTKMHVNNKMGYCQIGHEVTASGGTATASTMLGQLLSVQGHSQAQNAYFHYGDFASGTSDYAYDANFWEAEHSPSYTVGQKIWYSLIGYSSSGTWYITNNGDVRFKAIEIQG